MLFRSNISSKLSAADPIHGKSVSVSDLKLASPEEAMKYIQRYNNVVEKKSGEDGDDGNAEGDDGVDNGVNNGAAKGKKKDSANGNAVNGGSNHGSGPPGEDNATNNGSKAAQSSRLKSDRAQKTKERIKRNIVESNKS